MSSCLMFGKCNRGWSDAYESLQNWCSREHVVEAFKQQGRALDEKDIDLAIHHSRQLVEPVINWLY